MSVGRNKYGERPTETVEYFTWGLDLLRGRPLSQRTMTVILVYAIVGALIYGVWVVGINDWVGGVVTAITVAPVVLGWSTPHKLSDWLRLVRDPTNAEMDALLVVFTWSLKFLSITCLTNNLPFDVAGHLNNTFHSGISFAMGLALLIITGRDSAHALMRLPEMWLACALGVLDLFVLWYVSLFSLGGMYSNSGALQNQGRLATLCSVSFSVFIFSVAFSASVNNGRAVAAASRKIY